MIVSCAQIKSSRNWPFVVSQAAEYEDQFEGGDQNIILKQSSDLKKKAGGFIQKINTISKSSLTFQHRCIHFKFLFLLFSKVKICWTSENLLMYLNCKVDLLCTMIANSFFFSNGKITKAEKNIPNKSIKFFEGEGPCDLTSKVLVTSWRVSIRFQSRCYVHFRINILGKGKNSLTLSAMN